MVVAAMLCELDIYVCVSTVFFEFYVVHRYLSDWVALTSVVDTAHVTATPTNYVYDDEQEIYQNAICNAHKTDLLDQLLHYVLRITDLLFVHCQNKSLYFILVAKILTKKIQAFSRSITKSHENMYDTFQHHIRCIHLCVQNVNPHIKNKFSHPIYCTPFQIMLHSTDDQPKKKKK